MAKKKIPKPNKPYTLEPCKRKHDCRILSLDPGSRNFGISVVGVKDGVIDVVANSMFTNPITSLVDRHKTQRQVFLDELDLWLNLYKPNAVIAERFQSRGGMGPLIELVSTMNAIIGMRALDLPCKFITAATWKNQWHRRFTTPLDYMYKVCRTAPHPLDATLIGCYGLEVALQRELKYGPRSLVRMVEESSRLPLRRVRI
jgi:hypothetical protein